MTNSQAWDYAIGLIKVDGLEPTEDFKEYIEKKKRGNNLRGCVDTMTAAEQTKTLIQIMRNDLERLKSMPADEAKEQGLKNLQAIGILDKDGNVTEGYRGAFVRNAQ